MNDKYNYTSNSTEKTKSVANKHFEIFIRKNNLKRENVENKKYIEWIKTNIQHYKEQSNLKDATSLYRENAEDFIKFLENQ